ncbi:MAG TPA: hypothetical protein ENJ37_09455 [Deltaproteobacteria bacterium]|nr:hypothetical protein [Deltaproteobacteria bacterium]
MSQQLIPEETVIEEVKKAVAETLNIDVKDVDADSSLINDLGAESLDFLDINYRLEQAFGIKMARHFIIEHIEELFGEGSAVNEDNELTDKAVRLLAIRFGEENLGELEAGSDMDEVPAMITVRSMAAGVMDILDSLPDKCGCGASQWETEGTKVKCGACGAPAPYKNGDELIKEWLEKTQEREKIF